MYFYGFRLGLDEKREEVYFYSNKEISDEVFKQLVIEAFKRVNKDDFVSPMKMSIFIENNSDLNCVNNKVFLVDTYDIQLAEPTAKEYVVSQKNVYPIVATRFDTKKEAEIWCEENCIDYDYYEIREIEKG